MTFMLIVHVSDLARAEFSIMYWFLKKCLFHK